jgi:hypothetical protein
VKGRRGWEDTMKVDIKETGYECVDLFHLTGSCKHDNET